VQRRVALEEEADRIHLADRAEGTAVAIRNHHQQAAAERIDHRNHLAVVAVVPDQIVPAAAAVRNLGSDQGTVVRSQVAVAEAADQIPDHHRSRLVAEEAVRIHHPDQRAVHIEEGADRSHLAAEAADQIHLVAEVVDRIHLAAAAVRSHRRIDHWRTASHRERWDDRGGNSSRRERCRDPSGNAKEHLVLVVLRMPLVAERQSHHLVVVEELQIRRLEEHRSQAGKQVYRRCCKTCPTVEGSRRTADRDSSFAQHIGERKKSRTCLKHSHGWGSPHHTLL
jgi:hypothetical protein